MPDYGEILQFLAQNPPQADAERKLHASLLELLAQCLRTDQPGDVAPSARADASQEDIARGHADWVRFN